jgi:hypothetical protein
MSKHRTVESDESGGWPSFLYCSIENQELVARISTMKPEIRGLNKLFDV